MLNLLEMAIKGINWLITQAGFWDLVEGTSYLVALVGGTGSVILYLATQSKRFYRFSIAVVVIYFLIVVCLPVVR